MKYGFVKRLVLGWLIILLIAMGTVAVAEEVVLVDNENMVITVKGFSEDSFWGTTMKVYLENKTDKLLMYSIDSCAINGVMNDPFWAKELPAGSKANEEISWFELQGNAESVGITRIDLGFRVYDSEDWMADELLEQDFTLYPAGEEKVILDRYTPAEGDVVLFDNDQATLIITGFEMDDIWGYTANVYLNNKTDKQLMFSVENAIVNGYSCDPFWATEVRGHAANYSAISWMTDDF